MVVSKAKEFFKTKEHYNLFIARGIYGDIYSNPFGVVFNTSIRYVKHSAKVHLVNTT